MPFVFKTKEDSTSDVEIVGAGVAFADGKGGIPVERAAHVMTELQVKDSETGALELDDSGQAQPLTGKKLEQAAREYADARGDLRVLKLTENQVAKLPQEAGVAADRPPAREVAEQEYRDAFPEDTPDLEADAEVTDEQPPAGAATTSEEG